MPIRPIEHGIFAGTGGAVGGAGYLGGGGASSTVVNKLLFPDETVSVVSAGLTSGNRSACQGMGNAGVAGYIAGGGPSHTALTANDKFSFVDDTRTSATALAGGITMGTAISNSGTAGYWGTGYNGMLITAIYKTLFSTDAMSTLSATLTGRYYRPGGFSDENGYAGYFAGGYNAVTDLVQKMRYSSEVVYTVTAGLSSARTAVAGMSDSGTAGYVAGGWGISAVIDKWLFATDGRTTLVATVPTPSYEMAGVSDTGTAGYMCGGHDGTGDQSRIMKLAFAAATTSTLSATLTVSKSNMGYCSNQGALA